MKVEEGLLFPLYLHELWWLASAIVKNCQAIFDETALPESGHYIKVSPDLHARITAVLIDVANIKKLVATSEKKGKGESQREYQYRQLRSRKLSEMLEGIELKELLNAKVRNSLEHFDEYLDKANLDLAKSASSPMAAYNMTLSDPDVMKPAPYPIRIYTASTRTFSNMRHEIDLGLIHDEAKAILERVESLMNNPSEGPGALMISLQGKRSSGA